MFEVKSLNLTDEENEIIVKEYDNIEESKDKIEFIYKFMNESNNDLFKGCIVTMDTRHTFIGNIDYICIQRPCKYSN